MPSTPVESSQPYLHLLIESGLKAVVPMEKVLEVVSLPLERITPIPNMPLYVLGLLNQRSRVFWLIDLPQFLGLPQTNIDTQEYNIAVVEINQKLTGLVVLQIQEVTRYTAKSIEPQKPDSKRAELQYYFKGNIRKSEKEIFPLLDVETIVNHLGYK